MEQHSIISESTLLSEGLQHYLTLNRLAKVDLISLKELKKTGNTSLNVGHFIWLDVIPEIKKLIKLTQTISNQRPCQKILAFGEFRDSPRIRSLFKAGASAYLLSNCGTQSIKEAIQHVYKGEFFIDPRLTYQLEESLFQPKSALSTNNRLTRREKQVLQLIVDEYTTHEIANKLFISFCTVETHRLHLIQKLGVRNMAGLVREAISANLVD
ncbi:LuxR C-terminal-related transcriptional regulator [Algoriphagus resistens]|uniref:LuxR C-terminal-related transcriptional regulator n=1 Tax=Algoriphagus resistens TaxID=1750590 RepID=UPI000716BDED|nr:response regulator transcription factor [Algoriphagus resistens]